MTSAYQALHETIAASVPLLHQHCRDTWVVIGSAAAALAGASVEVADLDVLTSTADAERLIELWQARLEAAYAPTGDELFRSRFARFRFPGMPLEVMGHLELRVASTWQPVVANDITHVICGDVSVPIPTIVEQIRILESFGRPKDLWRIDALRALQGHVA